MTHGGRAYAIAKTTTLWPASVALERNFGTAQHLAHFADIRPHLSRSHRPLRQRQKSALGGSEIHRQLGFLLRVHKNARRFALLTAPEVTATFR